jgi:hypothetical protein
MICPNRVDPVVAGVEERPEEEQDGLGRGRGTRQCVSTKRLVIRSRILNWYS